MKMDDKLKIVDALVDLKITLNRYGELIGEYCPSPNKIRMDQLKKGFDSIEAITKIIKSN